MTDTDSGADDNTVSFRQKDYSQSDLIGQDFSNKDLSLANFTETRLNGAKFSGTTLTDSTFEGADCRRADFQGANLENSSFRDADIRGADLRAKNLRGAVFDGCLLNDGTELGSINRTIDDTTDPDELAEIAATHRNLHFLLLRDGRLRDARKFGHDRRAFEAAVEHARQTGNSFDVWKYRFYYYLYKYGSKPHTVAIPVLLLGIILIGGFGLLYPFIGIIREHTDAGPVDHTFISSEILVSDFYYTISFSFQKLVQGIVDVFRTLLLPFLPLSESEVVRIPRYTPIGDAETLAAIEYVLGALLAVTLILSMIRIASLSIRASTESDKTTLFSWLIGR